MPLSVSARARANLVYDYAVGEAKSTLGSREGLVLTEERGFLAVNVEEKLLLRFKKYRKGLITSGISTHQRRMFDQQQLNIAGIEQITGIVAGYELEEFHRAIKRVAITCRIGASLVWTIPVPRPEVPGVVVPLGTSVEPVSKTEVRSALNKEETAQEGS